MNEWLEPRRATFRSMGTDIQLVGTGEPRAFEGALAVAQDIFAEDDRRFSRFRPESELSAVNASAGRWIEVSAPFARLLRFALEGARRSGGLFDPTVLEALVAAGYDRDFSEVRGRSGDAHQLPAMGRPDWKAVQLRGRRVLLPEGMGLDFGGVAKGWTVDRAALAAGRRLPWALISAGGDLRLVGRPPGGWLDIGIEEPSDAKTEAARIRLQGGAVATSSVLARTWGPGRHHLIDPRTSLPAVTEILQATAWAGTCGEAEIRSKWALLIGPPALDRFPGILVLTGNRILTNMVAEEAA